MSSIARLWVSFTAAGSGVGSRMRMCSIGVGSSSFQRFNLSWPERIAFEAARQEAARALQKHRQKLRSEAQLLRGVTSTRPRPLIARV